MMFAIISLLRPTQWLKNSFIFLPLFFSGKMLVFTGWMSLFWAFVVFSLAASSIYVINDLYDIKSDRLHRTKRMRPLASGLISKRTALFIALVCVLASEFLAVFFVNIQVAAVVGVYYLLNLAYCFILKQKAILDILIISVGYILRLLVGGIVSDVSLSNWIVMMTFLLALFISLAKRRDDVIIYNQDGIKTRSSISQYNISFINQSLSVVAAVMIVCYIMYTISPDVVSRLQTPYLYLTTFFVVSGVLRYMQITLVEEKSGSPTSILIHDHIIQYCILFWFISFVLILYI